MTESTAVYNHPGIYAAKTPDRPAVIMGGSGIQITFSEFEAISNRFAQLLRRSGARHGARIAIFLENHPLYLSLVWGGIRAGLRVATVATHLAPDEVDYILEDCGARILVTSPVLGDTATRLRMFGISANGRFMAGGALPGFIALEKELDSVPAHPIDDQAEGVEMLYSSGTTGRPKGVVKAFPDVPFGIAPPGHRLMAGIFGFDESTVYLSPAPLYHAAPLLFSLRSLRFGATIVVMEKFDAESALRLIERHKVTQSQWVPTMFVRMLRLPDELRSDFDLSSLTCVIHAAAPCPVDVKRRMIDWFGKILVEYYGGSEGNGLTVIDSTEWLAHPGSVGRAAIGTVHVCGDDGEPLPVNREGVVYFADGPEFEYHNDLQKTAGSRNRHGWSTLGDIGYLDGDGYLYLTDRKANMIISGGVNIYPQEAENLLVTHPAVLDVAVIGVPDPEYGEQVKAIVQPVDMAMAGKEFEAELVAYCRERLSHVKCPRSVDFSESLPRQENGKLYKRLLRDLYW